MAGRPLTPAGGPDRDRAAVVTISELFLDTEHPPTAFASFARTLRGLGYSAAELDDIYADVAAALYLNTYAVAGEWAGFDPEWLMTKVAAVRGARRGGIFGRLRRYLVTRSTIADWRRLQSLIAAGDG